MHLGHDFVHLSGGEGPTLCRGDDVLDVLLADLDVGDKRMLVQLVESAIPHLDSSPDQGLAPRSVILNWKRLSVGCGCLARSGVAMGFLRAIDYSLLAKFSKEFNACSPCPGSNHRGGLLEIATWPPESPHTYCIAADNPGNHRHQFRPPPLCPLNVPRSASFTTGISGASG